MASEQNVHKSNAAEGSGRKRNRNLDIVPSEGQEGPINVAVEDKQPKSKKSRSGRHGLSIVKSRASSPLYVDAVQKFNTAQREAVESMGFGRFLDLQIKIFPTELSYALLNSYNPMNSKLTLKDGLMVEITEEDVSAVLGFPRGTVEIERKKNKRGVSATLSTEFKEKLKIKDGQKILYPSLIKAMLDCTDGGVWFKRLFMVLICSMYIEGPQNGTVGTQALYYLDDMSSIHRMNWCSFVMNALMETSAEWLKKRSEYFPGPLLFLIVFYVDRVVLFKRPVPRAFPSFIGWTSDLLKDRQKLELDNGGFCQGRIEARYVQPAAEGPSNADFEVQPQRQASPLVEPECPVPSNVQIGAVDELQAYIHEFTESLQAFGANMVKIIDLAQKAPSVIADNDHVKSLHSLAQKMLGAEKEVVQPPLSQEESEPISSQDSFWGNAENLAAIDIAIQRRLDYMKEVSDMPSFSLGFTPTPPDAAKSSWADVANIAAQYTPHEEDQELVAASKDKGKAVALDVDIPVPMQQQIQAADVEDVEQQQPAATIAQPATTIVEQQVDVEVSLPVQVPDSTKDTHKKYESRKAATAQGHKEVAQRVVKISESRKSPFVSRTVSVSQKLTPIEKGCQRWILESDDGNEYEIVFKCGDKSLMIMQLLSLGVNQYVVCSVIDFWSLILNHMEQYKDATSPMRFFFTTEVVMYNIVQPDGNDAKRYKRFEEKINTEIGNDIELQAIDLFFFPIIASEHTYVICINVKHHRIDIIDNSSVEHPSDAKYGKIPSELKKFFNRFLESKHLGAKAMGLKNVVPHRLDMKWRDSTNKVDCGIFAMRHMETYMGMGTNGWDSGLQKEHKSELDRLRVKYLAAILFSEINELQEENKKKALSFVKKR